MNTTKEPDFFSKQVENALRFYIEGARIRDIRLKVICGGREHTRPDFIIDRKDFPYYSIEFVSKGAGEAILNNRKFKLSSGTVFSYGPKVSQRITANPNQSMVKYFIDFAGPAARQMLKKTLGIGTAIQTKRPDEITRIFEQMINHGISGSPYKPMLCSALLEYLFYRITETAVNQEAKVSQSIETYQRCRQYIKDHFVQLHNLQDIAQSCLIDPAYLCRLFQRLDTQSPYQYLIHLKMAFAAEELHKPDTLIKEIAHKLGFDDAFHFSRTFKNIFGVSPKAFKNLRATHAE